MFGTHCRASDSVCTARAIRSLATAVASLLSATLTLGFFPWCVARTQYRNMPAASVWANRKQSIRPEWALQRDAVLPERKAFCQLHRRHARGTPPPWPMLAGDYFRRVCLAREGFGDFLLMPPRKIPCVEEPVSLAWPRISCNLCCVFVVGWQIPRGRRERMACRCLCPTVRGRLMRFLSGSTVPSVF